MIVKWAFALLSSAIILYYILQLNFVGLTIEQSGSFYSTSSKPLYTFSPSANKELVVHGVFFDERCYRRGHTNVTIILITIERKIYLSNWVTACGVGLITSDDFLVRPTLQQAKRFRKFTYEQYVLECYDLPIDNGSKVFIRYKNADNTPERIVESEVTMPAPRPQLSGKYNFTVATCTKAFNNKIKYLPEFVRYQKTIGVDHVHLSVLDEFMRDGSFRDIVLKDDFLYQSLSSGYLTITVLNVWYKKGETYLYSSVFQRLGCFYRLRGTYDYISITDTDDFFTPRIPGATDIKYYIKKYCIEEAAHAGSCQFQWRWLYPDICGTSGQVGSDGNVTKTVNVPAMEAYHKNSKSIHSSKAVIDFTFHDAKGRGCLLPGYRVVEMPPAFVYFAHNRLAAKNKSVEIC